MKQLFCVNQFDHQGNSLSDHWMRIKGDSNNLKIVFDLSLLNLFNFSQNLLTSIIVLFLTVEPSLPLHSFLSFFLCFPLTFQFFQFLFPSAFQFYNKVFSTRCNSKSHMTIKYSHKYNSCKRMNSRILTLHTVENRFQHIQVSFQSICERAHLEL